MVEGTPFGKYVLVEELGRGAMGIVHKAWDPALSRHVAIKFLADGAPSEQLERFLREARSTAGLKHPNLARVFESGEQGGRYYMVMQYVPGGDLSHKTLEPKRAAEIVRDVARGVHCAHEARIIHRDIKPANILLDEKGTPYVTDFGLAKLQSAGHGITRLGSTVGSPSYMSPEQACGLSGKIGPRSDVYSLGATLYSLLTGKRPFDEGTAVETMLAVRDKAVLPPSRHVPGLSPILERICLKAMSKRPEDRHPSAAALAEDLDRFLAGLEIPARVRRATTTSRRRRPARAGRNRFVIAAAVGLLAALLLAGAAWRFLPRAAPRPDDPTPEAPALTPAWVRLAGGSVVLVEWAGRPAPGSASRVRWHGAEISLAGDDVSEVIPGPPASPAAAVPARRGRLGRGDFDESRSRIDFDRDPTGRGIMTSLDVELIWRSLGVVLGTSAAGARVRADGFVVESWSRGLSGAVDSPRWTGSVSIEFFVPGTIDPSTRRGVPAGVHRLGVFVANVGPGGTGLRAYGPDGSVLLEVLSERMGTDFLGVESPAPIHRAEVFPIPEFDPDVTTDDWVFDEIRSPGGDEWRFTVRCSSGETLLVSTFRGDAEALTLSLYGGGVPWRLPLADVVEVLPPTDRLHGPGPFSEVPPDEPIEGWGPEGIVRATDESVPWEQIYRIRR